MALTPDFTVPDFPTLLLRKFFPERTDKESGIIRDYLVMHLDEFDAVSFSVRIGQGASTLPELLPAIQRAIVFSTKKRIDVVAWRGEQVTLIEAKQTVGHAVLGQLLRDRQLWLEDHPDALEPALVAIGRESDEESLRVLRDHGITVYLYEASVELGKDRVAQKTIR